MSGLTIEQVLARSLRMPRRRLQNAGKVGLGSLLPADAPPVTTITTTTSSSAPAPTPSPPPVAAVGKKLAPKPVDPSAAAIATSPSVAKAGAAIPRSAPEKEIDPYVNRPLLRALPKTNFLRTSNDLLSHLSSCRRLGDWQDALASFIRVSGPDGQGIGGERKLGGSSRSSGATTNNAHASVVVSALLEADREVAARALVAEKLVAASTLDKAFLSAASARSRDQDWLGALSLLGRVQRQPAPVAAYNDIIAGCEGPKLWEAALAITMGLREAHLADVAVQAAADRAAHAATTGQEDGNTTNNSSASSDDKEAGGQEEQKGEREEEGTAHASAPVSTSTVVRPDAVTYAAAISVLEQCGQERHSHDLLRLVPEPEREAIMASYAALIFAWSEQRGRQMKK